MKAKILQVDPTSPQPQRIKEAARLIREGKLVAFPTDTVYGLGADAFNEKAVEKVFEVKGRSKDKPLPLLVSSFVGAKPLVEEIPPQALLLANSFWPGALTLVLKASRKVPALLTSNSHKVGVRVPDNKIALALIKAAGTPLTGSSANLSGNPQPRGAEEVGKELGEKLALIIDGGRAKLGGSSTVIDISDDQPRILRQGVISQARIEKVLGARLPKTILFVCTGNSCRSVMAKSIFQKMLEEAGKKDIRLTSAGTAAPEGVEPPWEVEEAMKKEKVDVSSHRATPLTVDLIEEANLILVMGKRHRQVVLEMSPGAVGRIFLLKEFSPDLAKGSLDIPDPIGKPLKIYQEVFQEIKSYLQELVKKVDGYL